MCIQLSDYIFASFACERKCNEISKYYMFSCILVSTLSCTPQRPVLCVLQLTMTVLSLVVWYVLIFIASPDQTRTRVARELRSESLHQWEFPQLSLIDQTRTRVAWELTRESLHESFLNFHCLIKREQYDNIFVFVACSSR